MAASSISLLPDAKQEYPIPGLIGKLDFITEERERRIVNYLDQREWDQVIPGSVSSRHIQQFGYRYDYGTRSINRQPAHPLEGDILEIAQYLQKNRWLPVPLATPVPRELPSSNKEGISNLQCIANEYYRGQGITPHSDSTSFGPVVISISLMEDTVMTFTHEKDGAGVASGTGKPPGRSYDVFLPRRSIVVLEGESRYNWKHSISNKVNYINPSGEKINKGQDYRRVSLTYRTVST